MENKIKELKQKIEDLKIRLPAHSIKPAMVEELENLEEELSKLLQISRKSSNQNKI